MKLQDDRVSWVNSDLIRPYVFVREDNRIKSPGSLHTSLDWFNSDKVLYKNPLHMSESNFGNQILKLESFAFGPSGMAMPRWVFYDCGIVPGFVAGFAAHKSFLSDEVKKKLDVDPSLEWIPISLFIIIPTMSSQGEWVAHNLCSANSFLEKKDKLYGLGFLSKAFGLWYANVRICCGFTQWGNPAIKLHAYYGEFEVLTAYTPMHSYAKTLTYRVEVKPSFWIRFFTKESLSEFESIFIDTGLCVNPIDENSLIEIQKNLQDKKGPYFLKAGEVIKSDAKAPLNLYQKK